MDTDVGAARLRMMRVAATMQVMKTHNSTMVDSSQFQRALDQSSTALDATSPDNGKTAPESGANVQDLMQSESYRYPRINNPAIEETSGSQVFNTSHKSAGVSTENTSTTQNQTSSELLAAPGGKSSIPVAEDYDSLDSLLAAFGGLSGNPIKAEDWRAYKPDLWSEDGFQRKINETNYRYSLLNPDNLPFGLTRVEEGVARSTDVSSTSFEECDGGITRIDHFSTGDREYHTFIPVMEWQHSTSGGGTDPVVGDVYRMQTPFGFVVKFIRDSSGSPAGYSEDGYQNKVNSLLAEG